MKRSLILIVGILLILTLSLVLAFKNPYPQFYHNEITYTMGGGDINIKGVTANKINGNSMSPTLPHGSTLILQDSSNIILKPGMIVRYHHEGEDVIHRIIGVYDTYIILQGDNNEKPDYELFGYKENVPKTAVSHIVIGGLYT